MMTKPIGSSNDDLEFLAMNIVYQLADVYVPAGVEGVKLRQATNDKHIDWTKALIAKYLKSKLSELLEKKLEYQHIYSYSELGQPYTLDIEAVPTQAIQQLLDQLEGDGNAKQ